ncbi:TPA: hypothetical protein U1D11_000384 [Streptococcus suis]|nr:hypothetical protein [Streptococcus suis]
MDKLHFIRKSLKDRDRSENRVILLNQLKSDDDVQLWKENLQYLLE